MKDFSLKEVPLKWGITLTLLFGVLLTSMVQAYPKKKLSEEDITINGIVTADAGEPLPGVTVIVKGTANGVITGVDGSYTITADADGVLQFSYLGYKISGDRDSE